MGAYRYGFNGKEKDGDFGSNYDYGFRIYNAPWIQLINATGNS
jgi:uncharacterized protein YvpB